MARDANHGSSSTSMRSRYSSGEISKRAKGSSRTASAPFRVGWPDHRRTTAQTAQATRATTRIKEQPEQDHPLLSPVTHVIAHVIPIVTHMRPK